MVRSRRCSAVERAVALVAAKGMRADVKAALVDVRRVRVVLVKNAPGAKVEAAKRARVVVVRKVTLDVARSARLRRSMA